ncbi:hypothetical protein [Haloarchaeobius sp. DFWS5]
MSHLVAAALLVLLGVLVLVFTPTLCGAKGCTSTARRRPASTSVR